MSAAILAPPKLFPALICPACRVALETRAEGLHCANCQQIYPCKGGIWRLSQETPQQSTFLDQYRTVRQSEGWGSQSSAYYRSLPHVDADDPHAAIWRVRAASYQALIAQVVRPCEQALPLQIVDLGAGNGWLSYRLSRRGHRLAALDLHGDERDGLGAWSHYDATFTPIEADFSRLPLAAAQADLVIFNAALHYADDPVSVLAEARRVLRAGGQLVVLDSPTYHNRSSGQQMLRERAERFAQQYGWQSHPTGAGFFEFAEWPDYAVQLGMSLRIISPRHGLALRRKRWWAWLRGHREPAAFPLIVLGSKEAQR